MQLSFFTPTALMYVYGRKTGKSHPCASLKKNHRLERAQYASLDYPKMLSFRDVSKIEILQVTVLRMLARADFDKLALAARAVMKLYGATLNGK